MVDFRINWTLGYCRRELRFLTITELSRDSEIAPTCLVHRYKLEIKDLCECLWFSKDSRQ